MVLIIVVGIDNRQIQMTKLIEMAILAGKFSGTARNFHLNLMGKRKNDWMSVS